MYLKFNRNKRVFQTIGVQICEVLLYLKLVIYKKKSYYICLFGTNKISQNFVEIYGPRREKTCLRGFGNITGADQPAHTRSLISAFVIRVLESIICKLATGEISIF